MCNLVNQKGISSQLLNWRALTWCPCVMVQCFLMHSFITKTSFPLGKPEKNFLSTADLKGINLMSLCHGALCLSVPVYDFYRPRSWGDNMFGSVRLSVCPFVRVSYQSVCVCLLSVKRRVYKAFAVDHAFNSIGTLVWKVSQILCTSQGVTKIGSNVFLLLSRTQSMWCTLNYIFFTKLYCRN